MNKNTIYFQRDISETLLMTAKQFPLTYLTGPRQGGKTTLLRELFTEHDYINLENPDTYRRVEGDIRSFLEQHPPLIIDEAQQLPELFSYLQGHVDQLNRPNPIILSGSQNFLLSEKINQTLAGRTAVLELLPLSFHEYQSHKQLSPLSLWEFLFYGGYPRPYQEQLDHTIWMNSYIRTYLERDVRNLMQVRDLNTFQRFLHLCAGRHGQLLNLSELANDAGISQTTASNWLNMLEASYITFRLKPYHNNFNKRVTKTPKLYFYDSGVVCHLLGIESTDHLKLHAHRGHIFEGFIISEFIKKFHSQGKQAPVYFWRDHRGMEIDLLIEKGQTLQAIEIKSSATFHPNFTKNLTAWQKLSAHPPSSCQVIYTGESSYPYQDMQITAWNEIDQAN